MSVKDELVAILKNECGFTEKESINLLQSVKAKSEERLISDVEKFVKYINEVVSQDNVIRMIALGFTDVHYNSENISDFDIALNPEKNINCMVGSKMEQTTTVSKMETYDKHICR